MENDAEDEEETVARDREGEDEAERVFVRRDRDFVIVSKKQRDLLSAPSLFVVLRRPQGVQFQAPICSEKVPFGQS